MKKYLKMLPIMYHPYLYITYLLVFIVLTVMVGDKMGDGVITMILIVEFLCVLYSTVAVVVNIKLAVDGKCSAKELARMNMLTKLVQIPAYILYFILGVFGIFLGIFGVGMVIAAVAIDFLTIALTGTVGLSAVIACEKEGIISKKEAVINGILGYAYCIDVVAAVVLYVKSQKKKDTVEINATPEKIAK